MYRLRRSPRLWIATVILIGMLCGLAVQTQINRAKAQLQQYGKLQTVYVATHSLEPGVTIAAKDIVRRDVPRELIADDALSTSPVGKATLIRFAKNQIVQQSQIAPDGLRGAAALLTSGHRAIAIPAGSGTPDLHTGDGVDVVVSFGNIDSDTPATTVAKGATVIAKQESGITLSVLPEEAERVAYAVTNGTITLVLTPRGSSND